MKTFFTFIFCKAYFFCFNIIKEKEFPQYFAAGIVSVSIDTTIIDILKLYEYLLLPKEINIYSELHGYFSVLFWIIVLIYVNRKKKYLDLIETYKKIPNNKTIILSILSIIYLITVFVSYFWLGTLYHDYKYH
jgi:hypothetical protein